MAKQPQSPPVAARVGRFRRLWKRDVLGRQLRPSSPGEWETIAEIVGHDVALLPPLPPLWAIDTDGTIHMSGAP